MAYLAARPLGRFDIREALATPQGPRSRTLVSFRGALTLEVLERAAARATRPLEREKLVARAQELGIPVSVRSEDRAARALLAALRTGADVDPILVTLLREALASRPAAPVPDALADVAEWIGASDAQRGATLRDLLRVTDRVLRSRGKLRAVPKPRFPGIPVRRTHRGPDRAAGPR